ncbi:MAG: LysM peptidoglycan-binding domain-containing protein [Crocinitomicaceae bacterium]|nr:LysM peptidoglycan-binding domain-containing protein [Crocinitomicaceae bacterium]
MRGVLGIVVALFFWSQNFAQELGRETVNGKVFRIHIVEAGNTLFGLQRLYDVPVEKIIEVNPSASEGLQVGQRLLIPTETEQADLSATSIHRVAPGETLFGISRTYKCTVERLLDLNPEAEQGLKIDQEIIVPATSSVEESQGALSQQISREDTTVHQIAFDDSIVQYTVKQGETLYSISKRFMVEVEVLTEVNKIQRNKIAPGDVLIIPLKKERVSQVAVKPIDTSSLVQPPVQLLQPKETYSIAVLLPFKINSNNAIISGIVDDNTRLNSISEIALDFYMGVELALDSLKKLGLVAEVNVFDTEASESITKALLDNDRVANADIVIGPIFPKNIEIVSSWARSSKKHIILPAAVATSTLRDNPYAHATVPSDITLIRGMAAFLAQNHWDDNVVLVQTGQKDEAERLEVFMAEYMRNIPKGVANRPIKKTFTGSSSGRDLARSFDLDTLNIFVNLTDNVQSVMNFINTLNAARNSSTAHGKSDVIAFGTRAWLNIEPLNSYYKNRYKLHLANTTKVDEATPEYITFQRQYRAKYNSDGSRYSIQGYDVTLHQLASLLLQRELNSGVMNSFQMDQIGAGQGWENKSVFIVRQDEFQLKLVDIVKSSTVTVSDEE